MEFQEYLYFAPLTHDGNHVWENRDDTCDFERIYNERNQYTGAILLCKALPLTNNLVKLLTINEIENIEGIKYANLCINERNYLNSKEIHPKLQDKMQKCIYGYETNNMSFRVNYELVSRNVQEYNEILLNKQKHET